MDEIDKILGNRQANMARISVREDEQEYNILGYKDIPVSVPFAYLDSPEGRCGVLEHLLRKEVPHETILAFLDKARGDGRWG